MKQPYFCCSLCEMRIGHSFLHWKCVDALQLCGHLNGWPFLWSCFCAHPLQDSTCGRGGGEIEILVSNPTALWYAVYRHVVDQTWLKSNLHAIFAGNEESDTRMVSSRATFLLLNYRVNTRFCILTQVPLFQRFQSTTKFRIQPKRKSSST